jgi:CRP-like cAMP-binding protein
MRGEDFALIAPRLKRVDLEVGQVLSRPGEPFETICFPEAGVVTFSDRLADGRRIGIGHLGYDGFAGWPALMGCPSSPHEARVTAEGGRALRISVADLRSACAQSEPLRDLLLCFVQIFLVQLGRTIVSSLTQPVETMLCRWTLMAQDRIGGDEIRVTHDEIAVMLGIRRASVTDALHMLEGERLIRSSRGLVVVRDRDGLRRHAGETYGFYEAEYTRLIAPFPASS